LNLNPCALGELLIRGSSSRRAARFPFGRLIVDQGSAEEVHVVARFGRRQYRATHREEDENKGGNADPAYLGVRPELTS